jgi:hypothetical protein
VITRIRFVLPASREIPAVATTTSPRWMKPCSRPLSTPKRIIRSSRRSSSKSSAVTPQFIASLRTTSRELVMARIGQSGRYFEIEREVKPLSVSVMIAAAFK